MFLLKAGDPKWIADTNYDSFYVIISHTNGTGSNHSTMHYPHAHKCFVSTKIKFKKSKHKKPKANHTEPNSCTDLQDNCKQNRPLWILASIFLPPFSPQLSQGGSGLSLFLQSSSIAEGGCFLASHRTKP